MEKKEKLGVRITVILMETIGKKQNEVENSTLATA